MRLRRPPLVEASIGLTFEAHSDRKWDWNAAERVVQSFEAELPVVDARYVETLQIRERSESGIPKSITGQIDRDLLRARDRQGRRCLQIGVDRLTYTLIRGASDYPGFAALLERALSVFDEYVARLGPETTQSAEIHYIDRIETPSTVDGGGVRLEDFFTIGINAPPGRFGVVKEFGLAFVMSGAEATDELAVSLSSEPRQTVTDSHAFRMEWHGFSRDVGTLDKEVLKGKLARTHAWIEECFQAVFTERGWNSFEPEMP